MRNLIALVIGKFIYKMMRLLGKSATALPGWWALKLSPAFLRLLRERIEDKIIIITGTNGKTTTSNMLAGIFKAAGFTYIHNQAGANMSTGIASTLVQAFDICGKKTFKYAVLEVDEAFVPLIAEEIQPDLLLVTNFFHDQVDRYGSIGTLTDSMATALKKLPQLKIILNGDDPYSVTLGKKLSGDISGGVSYFAFLPGRYDRLLKCQDEVIAGCPLCGEQLTYESNHYAQLGIFACSKCALRRPLINFEAELLTVGAAGVELKINGLPIKSQYKGFYNAYNVLAAVSVAIMLNLSPEVWQTGWENFKLPAGRQESLAIDGQKYEGVLSLYKNPTGLDQTLALLVEDARPQALLIALTDTPADGRDVSWIWDAEVEFLADIQGRISSIVCTGSRSGDMAIRLVHAGVAAEKIEIVDDLSTAVATLLKNQTDQKYFLVTYAALATVREALLDYRAVY